MENASKALLIAAAVLVVILIIAFGMTIMNSSSDTTSQVSDIGASQAVQAFNAKFQGYKGNINASAARNLVILIKNSNEGNPSHTITMNGAVDEVTDVVDGTIYPVKFEYDNAGYILEVEIGEAGTTTTP